ncbi:MAG: lipid-binding SYLF domain-containing protein [Candidatus Omnitrophica bacterium]|nr:lipid-binding SYLF domain-containing protein [Candidatus Omnitrophota bacterium]
MRKAVMLLSLVFLVSFIFKPPWSKAEDNKWPRLVDECGMVLSEVQQMPDQAIPKDLLEKCFAIAIFPNTISAGFGFGGKYGQGIVMVRDENKRDWSTPAIFNLIGGSLGWQIGGQATDFILLFMNRRSLDGLLKSKFKLGADAAVSAGPIGRDAEISTDAQLKGGILSYSRSRGLFAGLKLEGAVLTQHREGNKGLYGRDLSAREILFEDKARMPAATNRLLKILHNYPLRKK